MGNYKFYTPPLLAECLMKLLPQREYENVIDICCGSWNLLEAARKQFGETRYFGVDVDIEAGANCFDGANFMCADGREFSVREKNKYDLVLSNPPFGYLKDEERYFYKTNIGLNVLERLNNKRYENEMIQANLILSDDNGVLLFILPATFVEGETNLLIRKEICNNYTVGSIIKLPIETFGSSKINTYALIMINSGKQKENCRLQEIVYKNNSWEVKDIRDISADAMCEGVWVKKNKKPENRKGFVAFRGIISSSQFSDRGVRVFHSSSVIKDGLWEPSVRYCSDQECVQKSKMVLPGDIIVNRVGRFANYWCICKERGVVSDCLIVIKATEHCNLYDKLLQHSTNGRLNIETKGVATNYITIGDVLDLL